MIGFSSQETKFAMAFHQHDGDGMHVEEFHKLIKGEWVLCEPTLEQRMAMQSRINLRHNEILDNKRKEEREELDAIAHEEYLWSKCAYQ